jgi:tetratricopeptide (TPR) repeat protein
MERGADAMAAYEAALRADPGLADCHYNLALLCEKLARPKDAIRHMARYRMLTGTRSK